MADKPTQASPEPEQKVVAAPPAPAVRKLPAPPKVADERFFELAESRQNAFFFRAPKSFTVEDLLRRECWANVVGRLRVASKIIAMREDGEFYVELVVFGVGINWAETRILTGPINGSAALARSTAADDFEIRYGGLIKNWIVVRKSDGAEVKSDGTLQTEVAAQAWLREYLPTLTRSRAG